MTDQAAPGFVVIPIPLGHVNAFLIRGTRALLDKHPATIYARPWRVILPGTGGGAPAVKAMEPAHDKRDAILATALVLFCERGFHGNPTSLISRETGVATGTLFFYFPTKEVLIDTLYRQIKSEAGAALKTGVAHEPAIQQSCPGLGERDHVGNGEPGQVPVHGAVRPFSLYFSPCARGWHVALPLFAGVIRDGIQEGVIHDYDPGLLCSILASSLSVLAPRIMATPDPEQRALLTRQGLAFLWNGLAAHPDAR